MFALAGSVSIGARLFPPKRLRRKPLEDPRSQAGYSEPLDNSRPEALGLGAGGIIITGTFFMAVGAALLLSINEGDGSATTPEVYKPS